MRIIHIMNRRYSLVVRTWAFEACNPGSIPGNASFDIV